MSNSPGISILICTYNGRKNLSPTLEHIAAQKNIDDINTELLVIDNASTDGTAQFVREKWDALGAPIPLRIIPEPKPGKGNASITGYNACKFEIIIVCDDDNWLSSDYVKKAHELMSLKQSIGVLGGKSEAVFEGTKPRWFDAHQHIFAVGEQFTGNGKHTGFLWGAGMVFRKSAWDAMQKLNYSFFLNEQRSGKLNWGGDDTELCEIITWLGYDLYYDNALCLKHYMPIQRMKKEYLQSRYFGLGRARLYLQAYVYCRTNNEVPGKNLKYPLWLDKYLHRLMELKYFLPQVLFKLNDEGNDLALRYTALRGELYELRRIKNGYTEIFEKILAMKKKIAALKK